MSDTHTFTRTFLSNGNPVEVDSDLYALVRDSYGREALTATLADGDITLDPETLAYSFSADLAWLPPGGVTVNWIAKLAGAPVQGSPIIELRPRTPSHARYFGATVPDVLERMRGLAPTDFAPLFSGATGDGETVLGRFLNSASAMVAAAMPTTVYRMLTRMDIVLAESSPEGLAHYALPDTGGEVSALAVTMNGANLPLPPDAYSLDGNTVILASAPSAGMRLTARVEYTGTAPEIYRQLAISLAAVDACLSLIPAGTDARTTLLDEHRRLGDSLAALRRGEISPAEWATLPLENPTLPRQGTISTGRLASPLRIRNNR